MVGGLIMSHGDDHGLRLPPAVAPVQAVVLAVRDDERTLTAASDLLAALAAAGVRARLDTRTDQGFGRRTTEWELKGVPLRIEIGPRDLEHGQVTIARRDTREKIVLSREFAAATVPGLPTAPRKPPRSRGAGGRADRIRTHPVAAARPGK
ncbi:His/Gly/Thr/Pro-type tRNA ligase C-terminal domain-containing protein [Rhodococcus sp. CC-R104]|uniref:His/Gly/Thr/Pro-type tRNA ligase C-terminal domain-containing protein n=1 Tax=Rhodococcus chondri TaxID=3065941 RepID=A0ABU7JVU1_9NOCA|nr:His/Gly/Thr/Pro-type tRNA ligase C-terminal domain-containing protein [Rhodococcus sp. CC-R104]MEE2034143.1 His/Gly/Thr/Pro-type tRNA ligase C-terminal domain-containing protein [Rhodococcus sp. CC-R104]